MNENGRATFKELVLFGWIDLLAFVVRFRVLLVLLFRANCGYLVDLLRRFDLFLTLGLCLAWCNDCRHTAWAWSLLRLWTSLELLDVRHLWYHLNRCLLLLFFLFTLGHPRLQIIRRRPEWVDILRAKLELFGIPIFIIFVISILISLLILLWLTQYANL